MLKENAPAFTYFLKIQKNRSKYLQHVCIKYDFGSAGVGGRARARHETVNVSRPSRTNQNYARPLGLKEVNICRHNILHFPITTPVLRA